MSDDRDDVVTDRPTGWVAKHIRRYVEPHGKIGHRWSGAAVISAPLDRSLPRWFRFSDTRIE